MPLSDPGSKYRSLSLTPDLESASHQLPQASRTHVLCVNHRSPLTSGDFLFTLGSTLKCGRDHVSFCFCFLRFLFNLWARAIHMQRSRGPSGCPGRGPSPFQRRGTANSCSALPETLLLLLEPIWPPALHNQRLSHPTLASWVG